MGIWPCSGRRKRVEADADRGDLERHRQLPYSQTKIRP
jgi:hypothetical protein